MASPSPQSGRSALRPPTPSSLHAVHEMLIVSPRTLDQASPHFRPFPGPALMDAAGDDLDVCGSKDQTRRKQRFSTSSLPDVDW